ncbi:MAG: hypothetical protein MUF18_13950, partial [Fimbriiglobus sp.]|nr:hypothetical protein [Fimbriiglobus sp.]
HRPNGAAVHFPSPSDIRNTGPGNGGMTAAVNPNPVLAELSAETERPDQFSRREEPAQAGEVTQIDREGFRPSMRG